MKSCQNALKTQEVFERWDKTHHQYCLSNSQISRRAYGTHSPFQLYACAVHSKPLKLCHCQHRGHHPPPEGQLCIWSKSCQLLPARRSEHIPLCLPCFPYTCFPIAFGYPKNFAVLEHEVHLRATQHFQNAFWPLGKPNCIYLLS